MNLITLTIAATTGAVVLGLILFVVLYERFTFDQKQKKYEQLHKGMGLDEEPDPHDSPGE
jgi:hypothetical protein